MKINVPFLYTAQLKKKANKVIRDTLVLSSTEVIVPEYSLAECSVAATLKTTNKFEKNYSMENQNQEREVDYISMPKGLVKPFTMHMAKNSAWAGGKPIPLQMLQSVLNEWRTSLLKRGVDDKSMLLLYHTFNPFVSSGNGIYPGTSTIVNEANLITGWEWFGHNRKAIQKGIVELASRSAIIDGKLWQPSYGPYFTCSVERERIELDYGRAGFRDIAVLGIEEELMGEFSRQAIIRYPLSEREQAIQQLERMRVDRNIEETTFRGEVEIYNPEIFAQMYKHNILVERAKIFIDQRKAYLSDLTSNGIVKFAQFKKIFEEIKGNPLISAEQRSVFLDAAIDFNREVLSHRGIEDERGSNNAFGDIMLKHLNANDPLVEAEYTDAVEFSLDDLDNLLKP